MIDPEDLNHELEEAAVNAAVEAAEEHEQERDAAHRQGLIQRETRRRQKDG